MDDDDLIRNLWPMGVDGAPTRKAVDAAALELLILRLRQSTALGNALAVEARGVLRSDTGETRPGGAIRRRPTLTAAIEAWENQ